MGVLCTMASIPYGSMLAVIGLAIYPPFQVRYPFNLVSAKLWAMTTSSSWSIYHIRIPQLSSLFHLRKMRALILQQQTNDAMNDQVVYIGIRRRNNNPANQIKHLFLWCQIIPGSAVCSESPRAGDWWATCNFVAIKWWNPGSTHGRIFCLMAKEEERMARSDVEIMSQNGFNAQTQVWCYTQFRFQSVSMLYFLTFVCQILLILMFHIEPKVWRTWWWGTIHY